MLLTRQKRKTIPPELNMAAMIDVVFLLLIFFMCTSSLQHPERKLLAWLPQSSQASEPVSDFEPVVITVTGGPGAAVLECDGVPCTGIRELRRELRLRRQVADMPVIIRGDEGVPFELMVDVMDICYEEEFQQVAYAVRVFE